MFTNKDCKKLVESLGAKDESTNIIMDKNKYRDRADSHFQEMVTLSHKVDKIEKWVIQLADKVGVKLQY